MVALRASRLVCSAIEVITWTTLPISVEDSPSRVTLAVGADADVTIIDPRTAFAPAAREALSVMSRMDPPRSAAPSASSCTPSPTRCATSCVSRARSVARAALEDARSPALSRVPEACARTSADWSMSVTISSSAAVARLIAAASTPISRSLAARSIREEKSPRATPSRWSLIACSDLVMGRMPNLTDRQLEMVSTTRQIENVAAGRSSRPASQAMPKAAQTVVAVPRHALRNAPASMERGWPVAGPS